MGRVEGHVLAVLHVTAPDSQPVRLFTGDDEVRYIIDFQCLIGSAM